MKPLKLSRFVRVKLLGTQVLVTFFSALFLNLVGLPVPTAHASVYSVSNDADSGLGTLRQAIIDSNSFGSGNSITFTSGSHTINLASALPAITQIVTIDGSANLDVNGNPTIEINGTSAGGAADGLLLKSCCITIKSLIINRFGGNGINIQGPSSNSNIVINSFIGTSPTGNTAQANSTGIKIQSSSNNIIGGTSSGTRNIISGNTVNGVWVLGPNASNNSVFGNYIGLGLSGTALPNTQGVKLDGATNSKIGNYTTTFARNIISGNTDNGVLLTGSLTTGNQVMGNYIGTNIAGDAAIKNRTGVRVDGASTNIIGGGTQSGMGNLISGNQNGYGVLLINSGATGNAVEGNFIGTTASGDAGLGNGAGVGIIDAPNNTIGGSTLLRRNIISGHTNGSGIEIYSPQSTGNKVIGNYIGTGVGGTFALPNVNGVQVGIDASNNLIGDIGTTDGNLISGNSRSGINLIKGNSSNIATNNIIRHNNIGVNKDGTVALANLNGILIEGTSSNTIGGTINPQGYRNIISGNTQAGIVITDYNTVVAQDNLIQGNYIGLSFSGLVGIPNTDGIVLNGASGTIIGKTDANTVNNYRNYITSNTNSEITVTGTSTATNKSIGNLFGYKADNTLFPGGGKGITVFNGGRLQLTKYNRVT